MTIRKMINRSHMGEHTTSRFGERRQGKRMLFAAEWPAEIWAVEYTNIRDQRIVEVMESLDAAQLFIEKVNRNYWANPVLLHSQANFAPTCLPD